MKIIEPSKTSYSKVVIVDNKVQAFDISAVYNDGNTLQIKTSSNNPLDLVEVSLISLSGSIVKSQKIAITSSSQLKVGISDLAPGEYIIRLADNKGNLATQRFIKLK